MLRQCLPGLSRKLYIRRIHCRSFSSAAAVCSSQPNEPLHLDPSLQALLKDIDVSLLGQKEASAKSPRELEILDHSLTQEPVENPEENVGRRSPAARFGSHSIGAVVLPFQLQSSINLLISESDRPQLRSDAKRLFYDGEVGKGPEGDWEARYDTRYKSRQQAARHSERDGTAFVSIALPAHYSAIYSVLESIKRRLEPSWRVEKVIDWGSGTGSGLWLSFPAISKSQPCLKHTQHSDSHDLQVSDSTINTYLGIDKRDGLVAMGKRLFRNIGLGGLSLTWQKSFKDDDRIRRMDGHGNLVKEMWESGAHVMVIIDHNTKSGFTAVAEAREYLLQMGRKEAEDPDAAEWPIRGAHVIAPCPHDTSCPLHRATSSHLVCGFTQRLQRPPFVRLTKHSGVGHEDIGYSYVVVRRGPRPEASTTTMGRLGEVGLNALAKEALAQQSVKELIVHTEHERTSTSPDQYNSTAAINAPPNVDSLSQEELNTALRLEAFSWPRLVFPPLKKSGHIILDGCTPEGKIMRMTIPRSQGKQPFYDARKSSWGDLFPHPPKNAPQERPQFLRSNDAKPIKGGDIGKRRGFDMTKNQPTYASISDEIKKERKKRRKNREQLY
ncbi:mitochondrial small ribosomal subunit Rsm22-domain-containing protein [Infundibulicybe gibba]|nr:mitochondrial small ribosomal subunit Rsm22-domain-containing protein [Infundibulicybe gibba]